MINLKDYQKKAIEGLKKKVQRVLNSPENGIIIFQAPTGSGKTLMVSEMLRKLVKENQIKYSFVWVSVRMLHEQSKEKLEKYYEDDRLIQCSYFEDLQDRKIDENEILFINWHSINKKDINILIRDNEQENNLNAVIQNTKEEGRQIILIIDESHHTAKSERSKELIQIIDPKVTIEVSATPQLRDNVSEIEKVYLVDVKKEEMIKSEIAINPEFMSLQLGTESSDEIVIGQALKKREEIANLYKTVGANVNPLVLIQLPDQKEDLFNKKDDVIRILKDKFNITEKNGKLAIWLSEEKTENLANIDKNDNEVEVLIFKQAIALGWDCPRAQILVIFRESKSFVFTIQTIGRIMRMPELKYYSNDELNKGFIFTNLPNIEIAEDYAKDYLTIYESKRNNSIYKPIELVSVYLKRQREKTRLSGKFVDIFLELAEKNKLHKRIIIEQEKITMPIIADGKIVDVDKIGEVEHKGQIEVQFNDVELQKVFDKFVIDNCYPYAPADSSGRMKSAIYTFFNKKLGFEKYDPMVQRIVLSKENRQVFINAITEAKDRYKKEVVDIVSEIREKEVTEKWEVPLIDTYKSNAKKEIHLKSIMQPFFITDKSEPEEIFMKMLDDSEKVEWWYKNRDGEKKYFAISYFEDGKEWAFYVDFIVKFKDGRIGLYDTKSGMTAKEAKAKAEALQKYIKEQNKKGKNLIGGIVAQKDKKDKILYLNDNVEYEFNKSDFSNWKVLDLT